MARKSKESGQGNGAVLDIPVAFGNLSVGDKTCRLGVTIDRGTLGVTACDNKLCERRLTGKIVAKPADSQVDQGSLTGMEDDTVVPGVFDVKGFSVTGDNLSLGLTFAIKSVDISELAHFAKRAGRLIVEESEELPDGGDEDSDE